MKLTSEPLPQKSGSETILQTISKIHSVESDPIKWVACPRKYSIHLPVIPVLPFMFPKLYICRIRRSPFLERWEQGKCTCKPLIPSNSPVQCLQRNLCKREINKINSHVKNPLMGKHSLDFQLILADFNKHAE